MYRITISSAGGSRDTIRRSARRQIVRARCKARPVGLYEMASKRTLPIPAPPDRRRFRHRLLTWYRRHGRDLPWRRTSDPYHILVSEIMLQQTQVDRVVPKYAEWLDKYPSFDAL